MCTGTMRRYKKNIIAFGAYVTLFPQLIAGPIVRYNTIAEQLDNRRESFDMFLTAWFGSAPGSPKGSARQ